MTPIDRTINRILEREGSEFTDPPADLGGPTRHGITQRTLTIWIGHDATVNDVRNLTKNNAREIYRKLYVLRPQFHLITDPALQAQLIDCGVLHGTGWTIRRLQEILGAKVDGIIGPITLEAVNFDTALNGLNEKFLSRRIRRCVRIVDRDSTQMVWLWGWQKRALDVYFEG